MDLLFHRYIQYRDNTYSIRFALEFSFSGQYLSFNAGRGGKNKLDASGKLIFTQVLSADSAPFFEK